MSWRATAYVKTLTTVTPYEKLLLFVLADYHNTQRRAAWPSIRLLAEESLMTERNCFKLLEKLTQPREGHPRGIIRKRKSGVGRGFINEYQFVELDAEVIEKPERGSLLSVPPPERNAERKDEPKGERKPETLDTTIRKEQENHITTEQKQHAYGALRDWRQIKEALRAQLPPDEFNHWVRPLFPLKLMGTTLLLALPPNKAMVCAAKNRSEMLRSLLAERGYDGFCLTHYPDANQRERLRMEYPAFYEQMFGSKVPRREGSTAQAELVEA